MDHRRNPQLLDQAFGLQTKGGTVSVRSGQFRVSPSRNRVRLRDGRSIRTVSALLLQLVQTSAHGVRVQAKRLSKARQQAVAMRRQESIAETLSADKLADPFLDEKDEEVLSSRSWTTLCQNFFHRKFSFTCPDLSLRPRPQRLSSSFLRRDPVRPKRQKIQMRLSTEQSSTISYRISSLSSSGPNGPLRAFFWV